MSAPPRHRGAIVRAAATLFRRNGFAATGINEIVEVSGAPKGSLYHYFPDGKDQIAEAAIRFAGAGLVATLEKLEKEHEISEDDLKRAEKELQRHTDQFVAEIDEIQDHKEQELMEV